MRKLLSLREIHIVMIGEDGLDPKRIIGFLKQKGIYVTAMAGTNNIDEIVLYHGNRTKVHIKFFMMPVPDEGGRVLDASRRLPYPYRVRSPKEIMAYVNDNSPDAVVWLDALEGDAINRCCSTIPADTVRRSAVLMLLDQTHEQSTILVGTKAGDDDLAKRRRLLKEERYGVYNHIHTFSGNDGTGLDRALYWLVTAIAAKESAFDYSRDFNQILQSGRAGKPL